MISKLAYVDPTAQLGSGVVVEPFAYIGAGVIIGDGTWIAPHCTILSGATIGKNCKIHSGAVIGGDPQDLKYRGEETTCSVGDNTVVREYCTINRGTAAKGTTTVGSNTLMMAYSHVGHDCVVGDHCVIVSSVLLAGEVEVGDWAIVGGHTGVHQFTRIGEHAMVAACSRLGKDVPPYTKVGHDPIAYVGINSIGLRRRGFDGTQVSEIQDIYRIMFQSGIAIGKAVEKVRSEVPDSDYKRAILAFVDGSKRGLVKQYQSKKGSDIDL